MAQLQSTSISGSLTLGYPNENIDRSIVIYSSNVSNKYGRIISENGSFIIDYSISNQNLVFGRSTAQWQSINHYGQQHQFNVDGSEVMRIASTGYVGIGTTSPTYPLHLVSENNDTAMRITQQNSTGYAPASILLQATSQGQRGQGIHMHNSVSQTNWFAGTLYADDNQGYGVAYYPNASFQSQTAQTVHTRFYVSSSGDVGIGTTTPTQRLDVRGSTYLSGSLGVGTAPNANYDILANGSSRLGGVDFLASTVFASGIRTQAVYDQTNTQNSSILFGGNSKYLNLTTDGTSRMYINSAGNVGIGTTNPLRPLVIQTPVGTATNELLWLNANDQFADITLSDTSGSLRFRNAGGNFQLYTGGIANTPNPGGNLSLTVTGTGNVGIGTSSPNAKFHLYDSNSTAGGAYASPYYVQLVRSSTGGSPSATYFTQEDYSLSGTDQFANSLGKQIYAKIANTGNSVFRNIASRIHTISAGNANRLAHYVTHFEGLGTGTVGSWYGSIVGSTAGISNFSNPNGTITNTYGLYLGNLTSGTQTNDPYAIYQEGTEKIYLRGNVGIGIANPNARLAIGNNTYNGNLAVATSANNNRVALIGNLEIVENSTGGTWSGQSIAIAGANRAMNFVAGGALNVADSSAFAFKAYFNSSRTVDYTSFSLNGGYGINTLAADYTFLKIDGNIFQGGINQSGSITGIDYNPNITQLTGSHTAMRLRSGDVMIEDGNLTVSGTVTAKEFHTEFVSASIVYQSGSTKFGDTSDDVHSFTGSLKIKTGDIFFDYDRHIGAGTAYNSVWNRINMYNGSNGDMEITMHNTDWYLRYNANMSIDGNVGIGSTTPQAKLHVSGTSDVLLVEGSGSTLMDVQGSQGQLFSVVDSLSGSLMSVNDVSGLPIMEVFSDDKVVMGEYGTNALVVTGSQVSIGTDAPATGKTLTVQMASDTGGLRVWRSNRAQGIDIGYATITSLNQGLSFSSPEGFTLSSGGLNLTSGNLVTIKHSNTARQLKSSNSQQAAISIQPNIGQSGTANYVGIELDVTEFTTGSAQNYLADFKVSGSSKFNVTSEGNVGIGTTSPGARLVVNHDDTRMLEVKRNGATKARFIADNNDGQLDIYNSSATKTIQLLSNGSSYFNGGNVGIGTTSPSSILDVNGGSANGLNIQGANVATEYVLHAKTSNGVSRLWVGGTGNVGIGTTTPSFLLDVAGNAAITGGNRLWFKAGSDIGLENAAADNAIYIANTGTAGSSILDIGTGTMVIQEGGNVGIGTTSPTEKLHVEGSIKSTQTLKTTYGVALDSGLADFALVNQTNNSGYIRLLTHTGGSQVERLRVANNGNVGIGTTSPLAGLEIANGGDNSTLRITRNGSNSNYLQIQGGSSGAVYNINTSGTQDHIFQTGGYEKMRLTSAGNLGIGKTVTNYKLDVLGAGNFETSGTSYGNTALRLYNPDGNTTQPGGLKLGLESGDFYSQIEAYHLTGTAGAGIVQMGSYDANSRSILYAGITQVEATGTRIRLRVSGSDVLYASNTGNVGIGTTTPTHTLEIGTNGGGEKILKMHSDIASSYFEIQSLGNVARLLATNNTNLLLQSDGSGGYITFNANNAERMRIAPSGNVGIGTTSPYSKLHIEGDAPILQIRETSGNLEAGISINHAVSGNQYNWFVGTIDGDARKFTIGATVTDGHNTSTTQAAASLFAIDQRNGGQIGIGTTTPSEKLEVDGNIKISGNDQFIYGPSNTEYIRFYTPGNSIILDAANYIRFGANIMMDGADKSITNNNGDGYLTYYNQAYDGFSRIIRNYVPIVKENGAEPAIISRGDLEFRIDSNNTTTASAFKITKDTGTELLRVNEDGNVGIGTTAPTKTLDVRGTSIISGSFSGADAYALTLVNTDSSGNPGAMRMAFPGEGGNEALTIGMFSSPTTKPVYFQSTQGSGWGNVVFQPYGGSVGIGTNLPTQKLHVNGNVSASLYYGDGENLTNVQRIPKVEYLQLTGSITTNDELTLPNGLEYTPSSNGFEYLEVFMDGIRLNRTIDYAEVSTSTVRYLLNIPVDSVITYKSLTLV